MLCDSIQTLKSLSRNVLRFVAILGFAIVLGGNVWGADEPEIPTPTEVTLETKDNVALHCTFYGGFLKKKAVPFMLVHGWEGNRGDFERLALELQKRGHAAITIDLRGHGDSIHFKGNDEKKIDPTRMNANDIRNATFDLEAAKKYLMERNNNGELNIDSLAVIAAKEGAIPALLWSANDWSYPQLPNLRQGQDVKCIFLLSPVLSFKGATAQPALTHRAIAKELSLFSVAGKKDTKSSADAKRMHTELAKHRRSTTGGVAELEEQFKAAAAKESKKDALDFFYDTEETNLAGASLVNTAGLKTFGWMLKFVKLRLVDRGEDFPWTNRQRP